MLPYMVINKYRVLIPICTVFAMALLLASRPAGISWVRVTEAEDDNGASTPNSKAVQPLQRPPYDAVAAERVVTPAVAEPDEDALSIIMAEIQMPRSQRLEYIEDLAGPDLADRLAPYRQAIEDVLPLMASLQARGDTVRFAQVARSVIAVWEEMRSIYLETAPRQAVRERPGSSLDEPISLARQ